MNNPLDTVRLLVSLPAHYQARLARDMDDIRTAQALRNQVSNVDNVELSEGLAASHLTVGMRTRSMRCATPDR